MYNLQKIGKLCYDLRQPAAQAEWKADPEAMMNKYGLSEEDRVPIRDKIARPFFDAGMHPILLGTGARAMGLEPMMRRPMGAPAGPLTPEAEERKKFADQIAKDWGLITQAPVGR